MDRQLFVKLMEQKPGQHPPEWLAFLEICEMYLKKRKIENPVVVELGVFKNKQKRFYEQLLGAKHIGIDYSDKYSVPDILGDTHDPKTLEMLKEKLNGNKIHILFIDACHSYRDVRGDFETYAPLCSDIIAFHDIENNRYVTDESRMVWKLWDELKEGGKYGAFTSFAIHHYMGIGNMRQMGIGVMVKNGDTD